MGFVKQWRGVTRYVIADPGTFFSNYAEDHGVGYPLAFLALTFAAVTLPLAALSGGANISTPTDALAGVGVIVGVFGGLLWILSVVEALVAHVVLHCFGARGVATTLEAYAFPAIVRYGLWWLPFVNLALGVYGLYLQIRGLSSFHDVSAGKAAVAAIVALVLYLPTTLALVAVLGTFLLDLGGPV